jgi:hypothetical protein
MTAGEINKTIVINGGNEVERPRTTKGTTQAIGFYPVTSEGKALIGKNKPNKDVFGNHSRFA